MSVETSAPDRCPISFDHDSHEHAENWEEIYRNMREVCPRAWTDRHDGYWIATRHKDLIAIAQQPDVFSAYKHYDARTGVAKGGNTIPPFPTPRGVPNESEGKEWENARALLNPTFSPKAAERRRPRVRQLAAALIDKVIETGELDIVEDLTNPLPALVTMDVFGFPLDEWRPVADGVHRMIYTSKADPDFIETTRWLGPFRERVDEEIALRRKSPKDDLLGPLANGVMGGEPLSYDMIHDIAFNIVTAGVDTTTALTSNALLHLSRHPDHRRRLIEQPRLLPLAREEFVRFYAPVQSLARNAKEDVVLDGWEFKKGERVLLAFASANRDPDVFENPEEVILDRSPNRHVGFGAGMHRCLGSFLARLVFDTLVTEVLARMPDYQVLEEQTRPYPNLAVINGWINLPATFTPGPKVGATIT